jgi:hypothetical protein
MKVESVKVWDLNDSKADPIEEKVEFLKKIIE